MGVADAMSEVERQRRIDEYCDWWDRQHAKFVRLVVLCMCLAAGTLAGIGIAALAVLMLE